MQELAVGVVLPRGSKAIGIGERGFEIRASKVIPSKRRVAASREHRGEAAGGGVVGESRLADAVEGIASVAAEGVVVALDRVRSGDADDSLVGDRAEAVVEECRHDFCPPNEIIQQNIPPNGISNASKQSQILARYVRR